MSKDLFLLSNGIGQTIIDEIAKIEQSAQSLVLSLEDDLNKMDEQKRLQDSAINSYVKLLRTITVPTGINMTIDAIKFSMERSHVIPSVFSADIALKAISNYSFFPTVLGRFLVSTESCRNAVADLKSLLSNRAYWRFGSYINNLERTDKLSANEIIDSYMRTPTSSSSPTPRNNGTQTDTPSSDKTWTYYIKRGDTLSSIATRYNTTVGELARLNNISNPNLIIAGAALLIPLSGVASGNATSTSSQSNNNVNTQPQSSNNTTPSSASSQNVSGETSQVSINVPYYNQQDSKWSGTYIGSRTIGDRGCLVTSIAMVESYSSNTTVRPDEMLRKLRFDNNSLYWDSAERIGYNCDVCSQKTKGLTANQYQTVYEQLQKGHPVIVGGAINPNDKGNDQHWVVITGYTGDGTSFSPSDFTINDPGRSSRKTLADFFNYKPYPVRMLYKNG